MNKRMTLCFVILVALLSSALNACGGGDNVSTGDDLSATATNEQNTVNSTAVTQSTGSATTTPIQSTVSATTTITQSTESTSTVTTITGTASEQPDMATFHKYFSELGLGKMLAEVDNPPEDLQKNASVFTVGDQICLYGTILQECQLRSTVYDMTTLKVVQEGGLPRPMTGGFAGWEPLDLSVGKYEYKIYVDDVLVGIFPFEVL